MAGITQKSYVTLFPLRSLKKAVVGYIDVKQIKVTTNKSNNNSNNYNNNIVMIIKMTIIKIKSGCGLKIIKSSYIYCSSHFYSVKKSFLGN